MDKMELIEANPNYTHVKLPNGTETTVALRHLAPCSKSKVEFDSAAEFVNSEINLVPKFSNKEYNMMLVK